jgi:NMD protein affecting ribosome stability and mRNA decay
MRIRTRDGYKELNKESLASAIGSSIRGKFKVAITGFTETMAYANLTYYTDPGSVTFEKKISIRRTHEMCTSCFRRRSGYFEATVQLRGNPERIQSMIRKLTKYIERRGGFITKVEEVTNGIDVYTSDKLATSEFFKEYELKPGRSYTLYGLKHGNKLYRNTYVLRL